MRLNMKRVAEMEGLPLGERNMTYNSRLAQELGKWAESMGKGDEFHNRAFRAYFAEGKNIGNISELVSLAGQIGLSEKEAAEVLETRSFRDAVDRDWEHSRRMGVTGVPTFTMDSQAVVGAQPYEALEQFMKDREVRERSNAS
jgi:predicted DsbA family dithiol-disulfide isomerase